MKILLTGVETNNKGAELMLYAILQEIERKFPESIVLIDSNDLKQGRGYVNTKLQLLTYTSLKRTLVKKLHINGVLSLLHLPQINVVPNIPSVDYLLDGSGLHFTDQMTNSFLTKGWVEIFKSVKKNNAKIIFLPQGFGPINENYTKKAVSVLFKYADLVFAREQVSYAYLSNCGSADMKKVKVSPDFTSLVEGTFPDQYSHLKGAICIIPNVQMVRKGIVSKKDYISYIYHLVHEVAMSNKEVYLLNHGGKDDEAFIYACKDILGGKVEIVTNLNALETKGLIASSRLVGVINTSVCLMIFIKRIVFFLLQIKMLII